MPAIGIRVHTIHLRKSPLRFHETNGDLFQFIRLMLGELRRDWAHAGKVCPTRNTLRARDLQELQSDPKTGVTV